MLITRIQRAINFLSIVPDAPANIDSQVSDHHENITNLIRHTLLNVACAFVCIIYKTLIRNSKEVNTKTEIITFATFMFHVIFYATPKHVIMKDEHRKLPGAISIQAIMFVHFVVRIACQLFKIILSSARVFHCNTCLILFRRPVSL